MVLLGGDRPPRGLSGALASCVYSKMIMIISELLVDAEDSHIRLYSKSSSVSQVSRCYPILRYCFTLLVNW
jgi:hypothetical protein